MKNAQMPNTKVEGQSRAPKSRVPKWLRILLPSLLILGWLSAAGIGGPYFGKVSEVSSNDSTSYLPTSADATAVQKMLGEFRNSNSIPAVVVFVGDSTLSGNTLATLKDKLDKVSEINGVENGISPLIPSKDGLARLSLVTCAGTWESTLGTHNERLVVSAVRIS